MTLNTPPSGHPGLSRLYRPRATWITGLLLIATFTLFGVAASVHLQQQPQAASVSGASSHDTE